MDNGEPTRPAGVKPRERSAASQWEFVSRDTALISGAFGTESMIAWMRVSKRGVCVSFSVVVAA